MPSRNWSGAIRAGSRTWSAVCSTTGSARTIWRRKCSSACSSTAGTIAGARSCRPGCSPSRRIWRRTRFDAASAEGTGSAWMRCRRCSRTARWCSPTPTEGRERSLEREQLQEAVGRAIAAVPEKYRLALVLRDIEGLAYEEIAVVLGIPGGTVRSRINRARVMLKRKTPAAAAQRGGRHEMCTGPSAVRRLLG